MYVDEDKNICFNEVNPKNIIFVYDNKIKPEPLMAIYLKTQDTLQETKTKDATVYTRDKVYELKTGDDGFYIDSEMVNVFGEVNVIEFMNNDEGIGDF
ncbi:MAG: phage portal protein, partial [Firmicutes bacterium]|nr:phage portal protein [Bacillota bacterium]